MREGGWEVGVEGVGRTRKRGGVRREGDGGK